MVPEHCSSPVECLELQAVVRTPEAAPVNASSEKKVRSPRKEIDRLTRSLRDAFDAGGKYWMPASDTFARECLSFMFFEISRDERALGSLGYPGFSYLQSTEPSDPAVVLLDAIDRDDLDKRVRDGLPWIPRACLDLNWDWLIAEAQRRTTRLVRFRLLLCPPPNKPFGRRHSYTLRKDSRQGCRICISHRGCDQLQRVALTQHCLGDPQSPICEVIKRCHADNLAKMSSEARTGHTGALSKLFQ